MSNAVINIVWVVFLVFLGWFFFCNNRTLAQRLELIDFISAHHKKNRAAGNNGDYLYDDLRLISYGRHLFCLMTFRDPMKCYGNLSKLYEKNNLK